MTYEIVIPVIIAFAISALLGPVVIPFLRKLKVGQTERKELESHLKNTDEGGNYDSCKYHHNIPVLCKRLSEDYSDPLYDSRIWCDRIFG